LPIIFPDTQPTILDRLVLFKPPPPPKKKKKKKISLPAMLKTKKKVLIRKITTKTTM